MKKVEKSVSHWAPLEEHLANEGAKPIEMLRLSPVSLLLTVLKKTIIGPKQCIHGNVELNFKI